MAKGKLRPKGLFKPGLLAAAGSLFASRSRNDCHSSPAFSRLFLKSFVRAITVGLVVRMLALAKEGGFGLLGFENDWYERRMSLVASIAKGLAF
jgi:hypothetical protein